MSEIQVSSTDDNLDVSENLMETVEVQESPTLEVVVSDTGVLGPQGLQGIQGIQGEKGDPGGWVSTSNIADNVHLDTLTVPGTYVRSTSVNVTAALGYPHDGWAGFIEVIGRTVDNLLFQRATSITSAPGGSPIFRSNWLRTRFGGTWQPWVRIDTPASGVGSPEGVVSALVGTKYTDTVATNGAIEWVKASGTGSTGWKVSYGDTGWRNLSASLHADWELASAVPTIQIRRVGETITLVARIRRSSTSAPTQRSTGSLILNNDFGGDGFLPIGFRPRSYTHFASAGFYGSNAFGKTMVLSSTSFAAEARLIVPSDTSSWAAGENVSFETSWTTANAWPTTLPGQAV